MKKIVGILLVLSMLLSCVGVITVSADAEYVEVNTVESFKEAMESAGDKNIIVTDDIIYTCKVNEIGDYWITIGSGEKTLNLNGKAVELNAETGVRTTMIAVPKGASLVINDTSGDNSGHLWCYGRMESPRDDDGVPRYFNDGVKYRNLIEINGGSVTVNGGSLEAGRSKRYWIYNGRDIYSYRHQTDYALQFGVLGWAIGVRYDGYAWQQVNGDCIIVNDGALSVNDGVLLGRGFSNLETYVDSSPDMDINYGLSVCLRLRGGITNINGGTFWGRGNASVLRASKDAKVSIKRGTFSTNHLRVIEVPTITVTQTGFYEPFVIGSEQRYGDKYHPASEPGIIGITSDMLDPQRNTVELNGETLPVSEWAKLNHILEDGASTVVITRHMSNSDRRNYMSGRDTKKEISKISIDGTAAKGMSLSPDILSYNEEGVRNISVEWYHYDEIADTNDTMIAGKYQAKVTVSLDSGYVFSSSPNCTIMGDKASECEVSSSKRGAVFWSKVYEFECDHTFNEDDSLKYDNEKHYTLCTVCGNVISEEKHSYDEGVTDGNMITYICLKCDHAYQIADDGKIKINSINISIPAPEAGKAPDYNGVINEDCVSFTEGGDEYTQNGIRWGKYVNDFGIGENDIFASDLKYRATVFLKAKEGYGLRKNQEGEYDTLVFVNGTQVKYEVDGDLITAYYEVSAPEVVVSSIDMMGIDYPEIGNTPDNTPVSVMPNYYDVKDDAGAISWYEDGEYMYDTDTFKSGKTYSVEMYVDATRVGWDDVVTFADEPFATLNGFSVDAENVKRINDNTILITYYFPELEEEKSEEPEKPAEQEKPTEQEKPAQTDKPQETEKSVFIDVAKDQYYYEPVMWAAENGITGGTSENTFSPDDICTRAQVVTFLHRMIGSPEPLAIDMPFIDVNENSFYFKPVKWAVGSKITGGTSENTFSPEDNCSRAQVVTFLWRTAGEPKPTGNDNPFVDVTADNYYYNAVLWAVENGITGGTSVNTFSPDSDCTRAQVVTFLYRFINK